MGKAKKTAKGKARSKEWQARKLGGREAQIRQELETFNKVGYMIVSKRDKPTRAIFNSLKRDLKKVPVSSYMCYVYSVLYGSVRSHKYTDSFAKKKQQCPSKLQVIRCVES